MNMQAIMAQAKKMQKDLEKSRSELDKKLFTGKSEWVEITLNGAKEMISLKILFDGVIEEDDKEALEDMIKIAYTDALKAVIKATESEMGQYGSALNGLF